MPNGERAELIDGQIYDMVPSNTMHPYEFIRRNPGTHKKQNGDCEVFPDPFAVFLNKDDKNYVEPDISIICDKNKLDDKGYNGAPDWIIEIVSLFSQQMVYSIKLFKYHNAGVRECWIVNPLKQTVTVYYFEHEGGTMQYSFDDSIPVCIYKDLVINIASLLS